MAGKEAGVSGTDTKLRPRLADVAQQAGVSPATASRVLTGSARVRPETRREVEEAIARLGYVRNRAPRSSAPRRTGSIAFVVCEDNSRVAPPRFQIGNMKSHEVAHIEGKQHAAIRSSVGKLLFV